MAMPGKKIFSALTLIVLSLVSFSAYSQCDGSPGLPGDPDDPTSTANCPLDTWVFVLVAITIAYTVWNMYKQKKVIAL
jgi:hypothetical protein